MLPDWLASITQLPAPLKETTPEEMVQAQGVDHPLRQIAITNIGARDRHGCSWTSARLTNGLSSDVPRRQSASVVLVAVVLVALAGQDCLNALSVGDELAGLA